MSFIASMILPFAVSILVSGVTGILWWSSLSRPWLYLVLSLLTLLGLYRVLDAAAEVAKLLNASGGYFLEVARKDPVRFVELAEESMTVQAFVVSGLAIAVGIPLLLALRTALIRT